MTLKHSLKLRQVCRVLTDSKKVETMTKKVTYTLLPLVVALRLIFVATIVSPSSEVL